MGRQGGAKYAVIRSDTARVESNTDNSSCDGPEPPFKSNSSRSLSSNGNNSNGEGVESNWNVRLALLYGVLQAASSSLFAQTSVAAYISLITNDNNSKVGLLTGLQVTQPLPVALTALAPHLQT